MASYGLLHAALLAVSYANAASTSASACATTLTPTNSIRPTVASGYQMALIATGLTAPRSLQFDSSGNLLVVEQGKGITSLVLARDNDDDNSGPCIRVASASSLVTNDTVSGLTLQPPPLTPLHQARCIE